MTPLSYVSKLQGSEADEGKAHDRSRHARAGGNNHSDATRAYVHCRSPEGEDKGGIHERRILQVKGGRTSNSHLVLARHDVPLANAVSGTGAEHEVKAIPQVASSQMVRPACRGQEASREPTALERVVVHPQVRGGVERPQRAVLRRASNGHELPKILRME